MATIKAISSKAPISTAVNYVTKEEKTEQKLQSGIRCEPETAYDEMQATKEAWDKTGGRQYLHFTQNFAPGEATPEQAHAIGKELAEKNEAWKGFEVLVSTHKDREHIHNHFIVNSVSYEDGHKIQSSKKDLENLKSLSDELCQREGLSVIDRSKPREAEEVTAYNKETYQILKEAEQGKAQSYVQDTAVAIIEEKQTAQSKEEFIENMNNRGYEVDWSDSRKNITFTDKAREANGEKKCKVRNSTLEKYYNIDFSKEGLLNEFEENRARAERPEEPKQGITESLDRAREQLQPTESRIDNLQAELTEIKQDRERASQSARRGSSGAGNTPDREQEAEIENTTATRTADNIPEQPQNRSGLDEELARIRAELQEEAERERSRADEVKAELRDISQEQQLLKTGADENTAEASKLGTDQRGLESEQQRIDGQLRGADESLRGLESEQSGTKQEFSRVATDQFNIKGEQQQSLRQQRNLADRIREAAERIKEKVQETVQQFVRRGIRR